MVAATRSERIGPWPSRSSFSTPMGTLIDCSKDELHCRGAAEISVDHSPVGRRWIGGESPSRILRPDSCCCRIRRDGDGPPSSRRRSPPRRQPGIGSKRSVKQQRAGRWAACPNAGATSRALGDKTAAVGLAIAATTGGLWRFPHGAFCLGTAPLAHVGHIDQAVSEENWLAVRCRHPASTARTRRRRFCGIAAHGGI
jgi:hypothetical protein